MKEKPTVGSPFFRVFPSGSIHKVTNDVSIHFFIHSYTFRDELIMDDALAVKKTSSITFPLSLLTWNFLLWDGGGDDFQSEDCHFVCASYRKHHVLSPVIMLLTNFLSLSAILMRSPKMLVFLFVQAPAFEVLNVDKQGACSTHRDEYCDNFLQKFYSLMQFGSQISFCHFSQYITHTRHLLHFLMLMDDHSACHCQHSRRLWKHLCQSYSTDFFIPLPPYTCCNMVNVSAVDFCTEHKIWYMYIYTYVHCSFVNMFNSDVTSCPLKKQTAAVVPSEVMKWQNYFCDDIMSDANLQDRTYPHSAVTVNYTSEFWELSEAITYIFFWHVKVILPVHM